jgi:predicted membrane protein
MKFTGSPRRWRKTLIHIALVKILGADSEEFASATGMVPAWGSTLIWGTSTGLVLGVPTTAIAVVIQLAAAAFFHTPIPELVYVLESTAGYSVVFGWFMNWVCIANAGETYRDPHRNAPPIYLEAPLAAIMALMGLPVVVFLFGLLVAQIPIDDIMPYATRHHLPDWCAAMLASCPSVLIWKKLVLLGWRTAGYFKHPHPHLKSLRRRVGASSSVAAAARRVPCPSTA